MFQKKDLIIIALARSTRAASKTSLEILYFLLQRGKI